MGCAVTATGVAVLATMRNCKHPACRLTWCISVYSVDLNAYCFQWETYEHKYNNDQDLPATIMVIITILFVVLGAVLFRLYEDDWTFVSSLYCWCEFLHYAKTIVDLVSVVTISTIGFGDMVPGLGKATTTMGKVMFVLVSLYMVIGLAILSIMIRLLVKAFRKVQIPLLFTSMCKAHFQMRDAAKKRAEKLILDQMHGENEVYSAPNTPKQHKADVLNLEAGSLEKNSSTPRKRSKSASK